MWTLTKEFKFEAAHKLCFHDGKCARLHGHSWKGRVIVANSVLMDIGPKRGMVVDYGDIKRVVEPLVDAYLDHQYLNETLSMASPTSEQVAKWIYDQLKSSIPNLKAVEIDETCTSSCRYEE